MQRLIGRRRRPLRLGHSRLGEKWAIGLLLCLVCGACSTHRRTTEVQIKREETKAAHVQADGIVGSKTLRAVNKAPSVKLLQTLLVARKAFYINLVRRRPDQRRFLRGWLNRTEDMARGVRKEEA